MKKNIIVKLMVSMIVISSSAINIQSATVAPNTTFHVTVACSIYEGTVYARATNASSPTFNGYAMCNRGDSVSVSAIAGNSGVASIQVHALDLYVADSVSMDGATAVPQGTVIGSGAVTILANANPNPAPPTNQNNSTSSTNNKDSQNIKTDSMLASLSVSKGTLTPAFTPSNKEYALNLKAQTSEVTIQAKAQQATANIQGNGSHKLKEGENLLQITSSEADKNTSTYTIRVNVASAPILNLMYGSAKLGILDEEPTLSQDYTKTLITIKGKQVKAYKNDKMNILLVYAQDKSLEKKLYLIDQKTSKVTSVFIPFIFDNRSFAVIDIEKSIQSRKGMSFTQIQLKDSLKLSGWTYNDKTYQNYALLYVMDQDGKKTYYQYEKKENTLQRYSQTAMISQKSYEALLSQQENQALIQKIIFIGSISILLILTIFLLLKKRLKSQKIIKKKVAIKDIEPKIRKNFDVDFLQQKEI